MPRTDGGFCVTKLALPRFGPGGCDPTQAPQPERATDGTCSGTRIVVPPLGLLYVRFQSEIMLHSRFPAPSRRTMADPAPNIVPLPRHDWDPESAARWIAQLEAALARRDLQIDDLLNSLDAVTVTAPYRAGRFFVKLCDRLLPLYSRRRLAFNALLESGQRVFRRLTGVDINR